MQELIPIEFVQENHDLMIAFIMGGIISFLLASLPLCVDDPGDELVPLSILSTLIGVGFGFGILYLTADTQNANTRVMEQTLTEKYGVEVKLDTIESWSEGKSKQVIGKAHKVCGDKPAKINVDPTDIEREFFVDINCQ